MASHTAKSEVLRIKAWQGKFTQNFAFTLLEFAVREVDRSDISATLLATPFCCVSRMPLGLALCVYKIVVWTKYFGNTPVHWNTWQIWRKPICEKSISRWSICSRWLKTFLQTHQVANLKAAHYIHSDVTPTTSGCNCVVRTLHLLGEIKTVAVWVVLKNVSF